MGLKKRKLCISFVVILALAIIVICISYGKQKIQYSTPTGMNAMATVIYHIDALNERDLEKANSVCADSLQGTSIEKCIYDVYSIETESEDSDTCVIVVKMNKIYQNIFGASEKIDSDITFWLEKNDDGMWLIVNDGTA
ncbi:MAG: hypothetical protein LUD14_05160 [Clostridiales bacterium]|nr:hypothetical protein [Clostridiales bacterium]